MSNRGWRTRPTTHRQRIGDCYTNPRGNGNGHGHARQRQSSSSKVRRERLTASTPYGTIGGMQTKQTRRNCSVPNCTGMGRNKGTVNGVIRYDHKCEMHHRNKTNLDNSLIFFRKHISNVSCDRCGWSLSFCDRHRIIPGLGYTRDNVKILCPNCHRLEHQASAKIF